MNTIFHKFWTNPDKTLGKNGDPKVLYSPAPLKNIKLDYYWNNDLGKPHNERLGKRFTRGMIRDDSLRGHALTSGQFFSFLAHHNTLHERIWECNSTQLLRNITHRAGLDYYEEVYRSIKNFCSRQGYWRQLIWWIRWGKNDNKNCLKLEFSGGQVYYPRVRGCHVGMKKLDLRRTLLA